MTADPATPGTRIRLKGGAPIPPAPSFGIYSPAADDTGRHLGGTVELAARHVVPVCIHCETALPARPNRHLAEGALRAHWRLDHPGVTA